MRKSTLPRQRRATLRIAIYLRVSTIKQLEGYGLSTQDDMCRASIGLKFTGHPYEIVDVFTDGGVSGKLNSRPDFDKMNVMISAGLIDVVVVAKLDRVGRTMEDIHQWIFDTTKKGVRVITADGRLDSDDDMFKLMLSILSWMADMEHILIRERTMSGREAKLAEGKWGLGAAPFGFALEGKGKDATPVPNPEEVRTLELAIEYLVDLQRNIAETCDELNKLSRPTRKGKPWNPTSLRKIIMGNAIQGFVRYRDPESGLSEAERDDDGNFVNGETHEVKLPKIIPTERVNAARAAIKRLGKYRTATSSREYLITKRMIGRCGNAYIGAHATTQTSAAVYRCNGSVGHDTRGKTKCGCPQIQAEAVEKFVWDAIVIGLKDTENLRSLADQWLGGIPERSENYRIRIEELETAIAKKRKSRKSKILAMITISDDITDEDGNVDKTMVEELKTALMKQEQDLEQELTNVRKWLADAEAEEKRVADVLALADQISPRLEELTDRQRRDVIELFDVKVIVTDQTNSGVLRPSVVEQYFQESGKLIPGPLTDEQWERISHVLPGPKNERDAKRWTSRRKVLDAMFYKARHALRWNELPSEVMGSTTYRSLKLMAVDLVEGGYLAKAVDLLGDYGGSPVPDPVRLPGLDIHMALAEQQAVDVLGAPTS
ncbi:recombinase family protein [Streptomyces sp. MI02-2A]|uniref:recombinase family protein n=1 Tax=Streptomyces sp. MI02-2A TaxID=3028688 RepID=UPI0029BC398C|nr:recombinase family protein [Streptomyces sp. MI02-2A]MDX3260675.1 recombinase family protein [Streptomyces sp. MI02-2A]